MTVHAAATVGAWLAGIQYDPRRRSRLSRIASIDAEVDEFERRFREGRL